jgi:sporulation protein YtfJ
MDTDQEKQSHPIEGLMKTAMQSIKEMVDVTTVVGDAVETNDGSVIIPISQVAFGFGAGGGEYDINKPDSRTARMEIFPLPAAAVLAYQLNQWIFGC